MALGSPVATAHDTGKCPPLLTIVMRAALTWHRLDR
jgi:hypothetical protein